MRNDKKKKNHSGGKFEYSNGSVGGFRRKHRSLQTSEISILLAFPYLRNLHRARPFSEYSVTVSSTHYDVSLEIQLPLFISQCPVWLVQIYWLANDAPTQSRPHSM